MTIGNSLLLFVCTSFIIISCSSGNTNQIKVAKDDSVSYYPPTPGELSKEEFRKYYKAINSFYDTVLVAHGFNGAILVAKKGTIIFEKYHGYANPLRKDTLNDSSAFHLASVSKTFTAMAIMKLAEQEKLKLDDDITLYFPSLPYKGITIKMLLSHRSGLPNYLYFMQQLGWDVTRFSTNTDVLHYLAVYKPPLTSTPGTHFTYCNTNYAMLGLIIEKASGTTYAQYLQHAFFKPLRMNNTYVFSIADSARAMPSFDWKGRPESFTFLDVGYGDKNIYSSARDLLKWDQAMYDNQLFNKQTLEAAFTPYSNEKPGIKNYGLGWRMNLYPNGKKIIFHNGWWHGNNCVLIRLIEDSATIIVLGNKYNRVIYDARQLANIFEPYFTNEEQEEDKIENMKGAALITEKTDSLISKKIKFGQTNDSVKWQKGQSKNKVVKDTITSDSPTTEKHKRKVATDTIRPHSQKTDSTE